MPSPWRGWTGCFSGLRFRVLLLVLLVILPSLGLVLFATWHERQDDLREARLRAVRTARLASSDYRHAVADAHMYLAALSQTPKLYSDDAETLGNILSGEFKTHQYSALAFINPEGGVIASARPAPQAVNFSGQPLLQQVVSTRDFTVSGFQANPLSGGTGVLFAYPATGPDGELYGVLVASLDLDRLSELSASLWHAPYWTITVYDRDLVVIGTYPEDRNRIGKRDEANMVGRAILSGEAVYTGEAMGPDGTEILSAVVPVGSGPERGLYLSVSIPTSIAYIRADRTMYLGLIVLALVAAGLFLVGFLGTRTLVLRPIRSLLKTTGRMAAGDLSARTELRHGAGELGQLAAAYDGMAEALEERQAAIERSAEMLRAAREELDSVVQTVQDGILVVGRNGRLIMSNAGAERMLGLSAEEILCSEFGAPAWDLGTVDGKPLTEQERPFLIVRSTGKPVHGREMSVARPDGSRVALLVSAAPLNDQHGQLAAVVMSISDITSLKLAEAETRRRTTELEALTSVLSAATRSLEVESMLREALAACAGAINADQAGVLLPEMSGEYGAYRAISWKAGTEQVGAATLRLGAQPDILRLVESGEPLVVEDVAAAYSGEGLKLAQEWETGSALIVPLLLEDRPMGVLGFSTAKPRKYSPQQVSLAWAMAAHLAVVIGNLRSHAAVQTAKREWEKTFDSMSDAVLIISPNLQVLRANLALSQLVNRPFGEIVGRCLNEVLPCSAECAPVCPVTGCLQKKRPCSLEWERPMFGDRWLHARADPVLDAQGRPVSVVLTLQDVTEVHRAHQELESEYRKSEERYQELVQMAGKAGEAVVMLQSGENGPSAVFANQEWCRITGLTEETLRHVPFVDLFLPDCRQAVAAAVGRWLAGKDSPGLHEAMVLRKDSRAASVELNGSPSSYRGRPAAVCYIHDISLRKATEELKDELISLVSHELRTPLTVMVGGLQTLLQEEARISPVEARGLVVDALLEAEMMADLVGNLLEMSRAQADRLSLDAQPIGLETVARGVADKARKRYPSHVIGLQIEKGLPEVRADRVRVERALLNLVDNACKYSPPGSDVVVRMVQRDAYMQISVTDKGDGIPLEDQARLFNRFERLGVDRSKKVEGTGLGLLVCRRLVEAHGGQIWVESIPGKGSTFHFTLPLEQGKRGRQPVPNARSSRPR